MRVIGGRDYYDAAVAYDTDATRIFKRSVFSEDDKEFKKLPILPILEKYRLRIGDPNYKKVWNNPRHSRNYGWEHDGLFHSFSFRFVILAGTLYKGFKHKIYNANNHKTVGGFSPGAFKNEFHWSKSSFFEALKGIDLGMGVHEKKTFGWDTEIDVDDSNIAMFFEPIKLTGSDYKYLIDNEIVVAIGLNRSYNDPDTYGANLSKGTFWSVNSDGLREVRFGTVLDHYKTYQEIDMFLGNILVSDDTEMVNISDKSKAAKHGFDNYSFKNTHHRGKPRGE